MASKLGNIIKNIPQTQSNEKDLMTKLAELMDITLPFNWERMPIIQQYKYIMAYLPADKQRELQLAMVNAAPKRHSFNDPAPEIYLGEG